MNQQAMVSAHPPAWLIITVVINLLKFPLQLNGDDKNSYTPGGFPTTGGFPSSERHIIQHNYKHPRRKLTSEIPGFISVDCGIAKGSDYTDEGTGIPYTSDDLFMDTGVNNNTSPDYMSKTRSTTTTFQRQLSTVRSFPKGINNCYTFKPPHAAGNKYLIRAIFMYGNYDSKDQLPVFGLYLEVDFWATVKFMSASDIVTKEIIHVPKTDYIHVCLVNNNTGTPFVSALEIRQLNNSIYQTHSGSLILNRRFDVGSIDNQTVRYKDDAYDRIWEPISFLNWEPFSAAYSSDLLSNGEYRPPSRVMRTAVRPVNGITSLNYNYKPKDSSQQFYQYMHFAEVEQVPKNQLRKFQVSLNGDVWHESIVPKYLVPTTVFSTYSLSENILEFSIYKTNDSTLPPILNALEIYTVKQFQQSPTNQTEVDVVRDIKSIYKVERNWQGDPCAPRNYSWDGLICKYAYDGGSSPFIIALNLSSSSLTGNIAPSLSNLKSLESLDLSNNSLTGPVPDFLAELPSLKTLKLSMNNLTGSVPLALIQRSNNGDMLLSVEANPNLCVAASCHNDKKKNKTKRIIVPVLSTILLLALLAAIAITWKCTRKRRRDVVVEVKKEGSFSTKERVFTHSELVSITNNFERTIGRGGSGTVYRGYLEDNSTQVAVKVLSSSSTRSSNELRNEVKLLIRIHHKNLATLVGYCNEGPNMALIYEYMENGNLYQHLSGKDGKFLSWKKRLQIAIDAAQGLEYLHNGCKTPIIHRDMKTTNILLNEKFQAKISDFGLSRLFAAEIKTYTVTAVAGTRGYLDPEYCTTNKLNEKSDVYSFGIVLLEIITGKPAIIRETEPPIHIVAWVKDLIPREDIRSILDPRLLELRDMNTNSFGIAIEMAMACVLPTSEERPSMSHVLTELKKCLAIEKAAERGDGTTESFDDIFFSATATTLSIETETVPLTS